MTEKNIVRRSGTSRKAGKTDWAQFDALTDEQIEAGIKNDPDAATALDDAWFATARIVMPATKRQHSCGVLRGIRLARFCPAGFRGHPFGFRKVGGV